MTPPSAVSPPWPDVVRAHRRHLVLAGAVAGLLAGPLLADTVVWALAASAGALAAGRRPTAGTLPLGLAVTAAVVAGAALADARLAVLDRTSLIPLLGTRVTGHAVLLEAPRTRESGTVVVPAMLAPSAGPGASATSRRPGTAAAERVLLRVPAWAADEGRVRWPERPVGAHVRVEGTLRPLSSFDAHERRRGAHAVLAARAVGPTGARRGGVPGWLDGVRRRAEDALARGLPPEAAGLARGMVLGQDDALTEGLRDAFRTSGLAHLVAASGANVALLAALVLALGTAAGLGLTGRLLVAAVAIAGYVPLAGAGASIQRAGVMGIAALVATLAGRPAARWYAVLLAAAVTLAWNPRAAGDVGWQLSFAAVLALLAVAGPLTGALRRVLPGSIAAATAMTLAATAGTAPLLALHFERLSLVSLPVNVLAVPAVAPVMWLGALAAAIGQAVPSLAGVVIALADLPLAYLAWLARTAADVPHAEVALAPPGVAPVVAAHGVLVVLAVPGVRRTVAARLRALLGGAGRRAEDGWPDGIGDAEPAGARSRPVLGGAVAAIALAAVLLVTRGGPEPPHGPSVTFLDVGQGDATLVRHGRHAVLVDAGPPGGAVLRRLREAGVERLDALVLTHASADHEGSAGDVLDELPVGLLLDGGGVHDTPGLRRAAAAARRRGVRRVATDAGQALRLGPLELRVLSPRRTDAVARGADPNRHATVLHVRDGPLDVLLPADAESEVTSRLDLPAVDVLKVAHHGSEDAGLPALLARLRPRVAVIPVGANTYGHPHHATLAALRAVPLVRRTDRDGSVTVRADGGRLRVTGA